MILYNLEQVNRDTLKVIKNRGHDISQKLEVFIAVALQNEAFKLLLKCSSWLTAYLLLYRLKRFTEASVIPRIIDRIINGIPPSVIRLALKLYDWTYLISWITFFLSLIPYSPSQKIFHWVSFICYLPMTIMEGISELPIRAATFLFSATGNASSTIGDSLKNHVDRTESQHLLEGGMEARDVFVKVMMRTS